MILNEQEKKILLALEHAHKQPVSSIEKTTALNPDAIAHASAWLQEKNLVKIHETASVETRLGKEGEKALKENLPERQALKALKEKELSVNELKHKLGEQNAGIALAWLRKLKAIIITEGKISLTHEGTRLLHEKTSQEKTLELVSEQKPVPENLKTTLEELKKRGELLSIKETKHRELEITPHGLELVKKGLSLEKEASTLTTEDIVTRKWKRLKLREYNVQAPVERFYPGKRHFVSQAMDYVRKVWLEMGFQEMQGPLINTEFWNLDTLFVPQDHPAREMQDTLFIEGTGKLPHDKLVKAVRDAHTGKIKGSKGWSSEFNEQKSKQLLLRTHTTVLSARTLAALKKQDWPAKFFSVGRCWRNEALDWKHGFEFNQVEGIVVDPNANFKHLLGYLREFFAKLGFEKARFRPSYFPYTEPSLEIDVYHEQRKQWVELGGAGIFRPEVTIPLLGEDVPVLAWGPGFDRIILEYYRINDVRDLYSNDIKQVRDAKQWLRF